MRIVGAPGQRAEHDGAGRAAPAPGRALDFASLYDRWFDQVYRWLRTLGAPAADQEDLAQEVFLVVRRRLAEFDGRNVAGWLYQIARRQVLRHKRLRWVKRVFGWSSLEPAADRAEPAPLLQSAQAPSPLAALEQKERRVLLETLVMLLSEKRRVVFVLFEIEGHTGEEIAELLDVPINTVWTRLHHARRDFLGALARVRGQEEQDEKETRGRRDHEALRRSWLPPGLRRGRRGRAVAATGAPAPTEVEVKQRVRKRLMEARVRPQRRLVLAPAIVLLGLGIGTAATATMGVRWWRGEHATPAAARPEPPRPAAVAPARLALPAAAPPPVASPAPAVPPEPAASTEPAAPATQTRSKRARSSDGITEAGLLFEATRALRRERDPARAGAVLDDYFRRFPRGTLAEEALAVAIEAASARGDARARSLGRRYLARYPDGHFREVAERALAPRPAE